MVGERVRGRGDRGNDGGGRRHDVRSRATADQVAVEAFARAARRGARYRFVPAFMEDAVIGGPDARPRRTGRISLAGAESRMNAFLLYLLLLKATCTSFSGMASLPVLRNDLVGHYHVLTDEQLTRAIAAGRTGPGPIGLYIVCTGYIVDGIPGAIAGLAAMNTPAFLIIFLLKWLGARAERPAVQRTIRSTLLAAAGLPIA